MEVIVLSDGEEEATVPICIVDDDEAEEGQLPSLSAAEQQQWAAIQWQEYFATANTSISPLSEAPHRPLTWRKPLFLTIHQVLKSAIRAAKHSTEAKPPLTWQGGIYQHVLLIGMVVGVRFRPKGYQCILDDGTGTIECMRWYNGQPTFRQEQAAEDDVTDASEWHGRLVLMTGRASVYQAVGQVTIDHMRHLTGPDEEMTLWRRMMAEQRAFESVAKLTKKHFPEAHQPKSVQRAAPQDIKEAVLHFLQATPGTFNTVMTDPNLLQYATAQYQQQSRSPAALLQETIQELLRTAYLIYNDDDEMLSAVTESYLAQCIPTVFGSDKELHWTAIVKALKQKYRWRYIDTDRMLKAFQYCTQTLGTLEETDVKGEYRYKVP